MIFEYSDIIEMVRTCGDDEQIILSSNFTEVNVYADVRIGSQQVQFGDGTVGSLAPSARVATSDVDSFITPGEVGIDGTYATVRGVEYRVIDHQPDGEGFSLLILARDE